MPYIRPSYRAVLNRNLVELSNNIRRLIPDEGVSRAGIVNYCVTKLIWLLLDAVPPDEDIVAPYRYADLNELIGALEACKLELYRRLAAPYENNAIKRNGDIWQ